MKAFQVFSFFVLIAFSFVTQGAPKPKFSVDDKVRYKTHQGVLREAVVTRVILPSSKEGKTRYGVSIGFIKTQVLESSLVGALETASSLEKNTFMTPRNTKNCRKGIEKENKTPMDRKLTASPARWEFIRTLPSENSDHPWEALPPLT